MAGFNKCIFAGNLTKDPEFSQSKSGTDYCRFSLAVNSGADETLFMNCTAFGKTAEVVRDYLAKGKFTIVEGRLQSRKYEIDGISKVSYELIISSVTLTPNSGESRVEKQEPKTNKEVVSDKADTTNIDDIPDSEIPF